VQPTPRHPAPVTNGVDDFFSLRGATSHAALFPLKVRFIKAIFGLFKFHIDYFFFFFSL
jgi:hypothetical protein